MKHRRFWKASSVGTPLRHLLSGLVVGAKLLGLLLVVVGLGFVAGLLWPLPSPTPNPRDPRVLITDVSIVDVETGELRPESNILIVDGTISAIDAEPSEEDRIVKGGGRFAIPGLFDMHAHSFKLSPALFHPLFVASGVTAIRDMGGCIDGDDAWAACVGEKRRWTDAVEEGTLVGPRYDQVTSLAINGGSEIPSALDPALGAATVAGARARVAHEKTRGIDFLKTYNAIPRDAFLPLRRRQSKTVCIWRATCLSR